jgi:hypothetical protein
MSAVLSLAGFRSRHVLGSAALDHVIESVGV